MTMTKLIAYMMILNTLPFLIFDRIHFLLLKSQTPRIITSLLDHHAGKFILFILIYLFIQYLLFKIILKNLYLSRFHSAYVSN